MFGPTSPEVASISSCQKRAEIIPEGSLLGMGMKSDRNKWGHEVKGIGTPGVMWLQERPTQFQLAPTEASRQAAGVRLALFCRVRPDLTEEKVGPRKAETAPVGSSLEEEVSPQYRGLGAEPPGLPKELCKEQARSDSRAQLDLNGSGLRTELPSLGSRGQLLGAGMDWMSSRRPTKASILYGASQEGCAAAPGGLFPLCGQPLGTPFGWRATPRATEATWPGEPMAGRPGEGTRCDSA